MTDEKKKFIAELSAFITLAIIAPIAYLAIRFRLFSSGKNVSIWGLIAIIIVAISGITLIRYYISGLKTRWTRTKQILEGIVKVIAPLGIALAFSVWLKLKGEWLMNQANLLIECFSVIMACEMVAIVINPLPKWAFDNNVEGLQEICDKVFHKDKDEEGKEGE